MRNIAKLVAEKLRSMCFALFCTRMGSTITIVFGLITLCQITVKCYQFNRDGYMHDAWEIAIPSMFLFPIGLLLSCKFLWSNGVSLSDELDPSGQALMFLLLMSMTSFMIFGVVKSLIGFLYLIVLSVVVVICLCVLAIGATQTYKITSQLHPFQVLKKIFQRSLHL